ncbi:MAG: FISUMP domain-containing protein, partial [Campylobacterota bacterium]|nr:FISUMP domain-containing protein [Campylobacterota bacterium]
NSLMDDRDEVEYETLALNYITKKMKASGNRLNIIILDACRNDPFSRSGGGGLAPVSNAKGIFIAYATEAGSVASDGKSGKNGIFTKYLVENLQEEGATIERVFKNTRADVHDKTNGIQSPGVYNQIRGDFFFTLPTNKPSESRIHSSNKQKSSSSFSFKNEAPTTFSLTINTTPSNARVRITNIKPIYYDGIRLKKGSYNIKVSKSGYITKNGDISLQSDTDITVSLDKITKKSSGSITSVVENSSTKKIKHKGYVYKVIKSPYTGQKWLDRNLGASRVCKSFDDKKCYGDYFNWKTAQNQCPLGFRVPTISELKIETIGQSLKNRDNAFSSFLKLPTNGYSNKGSHDYQGVYGSLWSSSENGSSSKLLFLGSDFIQIAKDSKVTGPSVRCIKNR